MFGKLFKKVKESAEELIDNAQQAANDATSTNEELPEVRYYTVDTYSDVEDYLEIIVAIESQMIGNENQFRHALSKNNFPLMRKAIETWLVDIEKYKAQINQLGPFDGNDFMVKSSLKSFTDKKAWVQDYYPIYTDVIEAQNKPEADRLHDKIEEVRTTNYNWFQDCFDEFRRIFESKVEDQLIDINFIEHDIATQANAKDNPLLAPIHGISLYDYAAGSSRRGAGIPETEIFKALGVEKPQWDEADIIWQQRMQEDNEMTVMTLFSQYFGQIEQHPKLGSLKKESNGVANANMERAKTDEKFFYELVGARDAAMECGMDGGQWMLDTYGIDITEFQSQAMIWMRSGNYASMIDYQMLKKDEYLAKFQKEMGGSIADDIEF